LSALSRTASGDFTLGDALTLEALDERPLAARDAALLPVDALVTALARLDLDRADAARLANGQSVAQAGVGDGMVRVYAAGKFAGVATIAGGVLRARRLVAQSAARPGGA